jgi:hypothetical protein
MSPLVLDTSWSFPHLRLITGFVTRLTRRVPLVEQKLPTLPQHLRSSPVFIGVRITRSLVLCVCFVDHCLSFCHFSFGHCVVLSPSIYGFWLPLWYLQTPLPLKTGGDLGCFGRVGSSCSTSGTSRINLATHLVISQEWGKDQEVFATSGTYPWSFHSCQPCHGGDRKTFEVMNST